MDRMTLGWVEMLQLHATPVAILIYFRPDVLPSFGGEALLDRALAWGVWALVSVLAGTLAVSGIFAAICLAYSPLYLLGYACRLVAARSGATAWVAARELRFYLWCFAALCALAGLSALHLSAGAVAIILISGTAPLIARLLD